MTNVSDDLCVVIPFATYQAYNQWPRDGRLGKSLYYGYPDSARSAAPGSSTPNVYDDRAFHVSFDRPYDGYGMPNLADLDQTFVQWAEERGYDMTYASSMDLHDGRVDPSKYAGVIFCGHDEYWSREMRDQSRVRSTEGPALPSWRRAMSIGMFAFFRGRVRAGRSCVTRRARTRRLSRVARLVSGVTLARAERSGATPGRRPVQRHRGHAHPTSGASGRPLVLGRNWTAGRGYNRQGHRRRGGRIPPNLPGPKDAKQTLLSASPYRRNTPDGPELTQNTSVYTNAAGALVFGAGSLYWSYALGKKDYVDERIKRATANVLDRVIGER